MTNVRNITGIHIVSNRDFKFLIVLRSPHPGGIRQRELSERLFGCAALTVVLNPIHNLFRIQYERDICVKRVIDRDL